MAAFGWHFSRSFICKLLSNDLQSNCICIYDPYGSVNDSQRPSILWQIHKLFETLICTTFNLLDVYQETRILPISYAYTAAAAVPPRFKCEYFVSLSFTLVACVLFSFFFLLRCCRRNCLTKIMLCNNFPNKSQLTTQKRQHFYALNHRHKFLEQTHNAICFEQQSFST